MNSRQVNRIGKRLLGRSYLGTFALDKVPLARLGGRNHKRLQHFIINTQTSNLPGKHWVAVSTHQRKAYYFDSFGLPPPSLLVRQLRNGGIKEITYNTRQVQAFNTQVCGRLALQHLRNTNLRGGIGGLSRWSQALVH